jgi:hypothetical protein
MDIGFPQGNSCPCTTGISFRLATISTLSFAWGAGRDNTLPGQVNREALARGSAARSKPSRYTLQTHLASRALKHLVPLGLQGRADVRSGTFSDPKSWAQSVKTAVFQVRPLKPCRLGRWLTGHRPKGRNLLRYNAYWVEVRRSLWQSQGRSPDRPARRAAWALTHMANHSSCDA